jgi:hypothetical protein
VTTPDAAGPVDRPRRPHPDPLAMTPAEKVAAEWEARHDVAARGRHVSPDAVQHYLAESRTREPVHRGPHVTQPSHQGPAVADRSAASGATSRPEGNQAHPEGNQARKKASRTVGDRAQRRRWWRFRRRS